MEGSGDDSSAHTSLRSVITQVTKEKLAWLDNQRQRLKSHFQPILTKYEQPENKSSLKFLTEIHTALKSCTDAENPALEKTKDLGVFLTCIQAESPEDVVYFGSRHLVQHWINVLIKKIKFKIEKCEYSCLYANVMSQYMDANGSEDKIEPAAEIGEPTDKEKTIQEFSERIFTPCADFEEATFKNFLDNELFDMSDSVQNDILRTIRQQITKFSENFPKNPVVTTCEVQQCIDSLIAEDLLGTEKAVTLKELRGNDDALNEVTTLLESRVKNFSSWNWPAPVNVDFRRNMAGRYRAYMDEDIITALFLHYVGARWSIQMKKCFMEIYNSGMWKRGTGTIGDLYYRPKSIEAYRIDFHKKSFLSILPSCMEALSGSGYDDENRKSENATDMTPIKIKQKLLHLISNEIKLNHILHPESPLTLVQTDMEWFGPSIVHQAVFSLMEFFGVTSQWIDFFRRFLESPLRVGSANAPIQSRKRGVPISHMLSNMFGESLLFTMDLYVNQVAGLSLYRIHDDFWFWNHNSGKVTKAWEGINRFVKLSGLKINEEKSASVVCESLKAGMTATPNPGPEPLPQREVKWGFITLYNDGVFRINQELLEPHVQEMKNTLAQENTVMGWVHAHNRYLRFFIRNFAEPAVTFGKQHVAQIMKALQGILHAVHGEANGDPVESLKRKFADLWKDNEVMDSWVHWPVKSGGLSLYNPFVDFVPLYEAYRKSEEVQAAAGHANKFDAQIEYDKRQWKHSLEESSKRRKKRGVEPSGTTTEETITDFEKSEDEYESDSDGGGGDARKRRQRIGGRKTGRRIGYDTWWKRYRETRWTNWCNVYSGMLSQINANDPNDGEDWLECLYSSQLEEKLGENGDFIDTNLVPLSLISSMQSSRVHKS